MNSPIVVAYIESKNENYENLRLVLLILLTGPLNLVVFCWESCAFSYWKPSLV